jgi:hypothetical protein
MQVNEMHSYSCKIMISIMKVVTELITFLKMKQNES